MDDVYLGDKAGAELAAALGQVEGGDGVIVRRVELPGIILAEGVTIRVSGGGGNGKAITAVSFQRKVEVQAVVVFVPVISYARLILSRLLLIKIYPWSQLDCCIGEKCSDKP